MEKTLITKLVNSVNADLLKLGELRISIVPKGDAGQTEQKISLRSDKAQTLSVVDGSDYLSEDSSFSNLISSADISNKPVTQSVYYKIDSTYQISLSNKYALTRLMLNSGKSCKLDIEQLTYSTLMNYLDLGRSQCEGDISSLSGLTALTSLNLANTSVSGDISSLSGLTALTSLCLNYTQVSGKVDSLANLNKLTNLSGLQGLSLTGDMSKIPAGVSFISQQGRKVTTNFTWTANGRKNATLLCMDGPIPFDTASMDNMFIDQATCTYKQDPSMPWANMINVNGTRTSASDAAVAAIQNMGVTITGVTKQA